MIGEEDAFIRWKKGNPVEWTKQDEFWEAGTRDVWMAELEDRATIAWVRRHGLEEARVLDIGAGSGLHSRIMFPKATRIDLHPTPGVGQGDATKLNSGDAQFDLVHLRRVLSNLEPFTERASAVTEAWRVTRPGGFIVVVDVFNPHHTRVNEARLGAGLPPLPPQHRGKGFLNKASFTPAEDDIPIGADYYLWTRFTLPVILRQETPFAAIELRRAYPAVPPEVADRFGVHRLLAWRKS